MLYIDADHEAYFLKNKAVVGNDVYKLQMIYLLGLCATTRNHAAEIYDIEKGEMQPEGLEKGWQTGTSKKITRLAFNLFNECVYENLNDYHENKVSASYGPVDIFCCSYAPFFVQALQLRFPEYFGK